MWNFLKALIWKERIIPCPGVSAVWASPVVVCCAAVAWDVRGGRGGFGEGAPSVSCSGACGSEHLLVTGGLTAAQMVTEQSLGPELMRDRVDEEQRNVFKWAEMEWHECRHTTKQLLSCDMTFYCGKWRCRGFIVHVRRLFCQNSNTKIKKWIKEIIF